jgi:ribosomal RNA assembly protein
MMDIEDNQSFFLEKDRIGAFIGKKGEFKKKFEDFLKSKIKIDSKTGEILIGNRDSLNSFIFSNMISGINYGHNPINALKLKDENFVLNVIDIKSYLKSKESDKIKKTIGRVIGQKGVTRKLIEEITKCDVSISDSIVCVIGPYENVLLVQKALEMLISGCAHKTFYRYLERHREKIDTGLL